MIAGVHYPMDSVAGWTLAHAVVAHLHRRAKKVAVIGVYFDPAEFQPVGPNDPASDFNLALPPKELTDKSDKDLWSPATNASALLAKLWTDAKAECQ